MSSAKKQSARLIPPRVSTEALNQFAFKRSDDEASQIAEYVEWQSRKDKERVAYLEKVQTEYVFGEAGYGPKAVIGRNLAPTA